MVCNAVIFTLNEYELDVNFLNKMHFRRKNLYGTGIQKSGMRNEK